MSRNPTLSAAQAGAPDGAPSGMSTDNLPKYTLVVVGDGAVGKSAITLQFLQHIFVEDYDPTIEDSYIKTIQIDGQWCVLDIFDTAGEDDFTAMRERYMRRGDGFLLVYSVTDTQSFSHVQKFYQQILRVKDQERYPVMLVGNKIDLASMRSVSQADGIRLGQDLQIPYIETSAKTPAVNVDEAFHTIVRLIRMSQSSNGANASNAGNDANVQANNTNTSSRLPVKENKKGLCSSCSLM